MKRIAFAIITAMIILQVTAQTPRITFKQSLLYPEGVAFNAKTNVFYVSSVTTGTISTVDQQGNCKVFYTDPSLKSSFGMKTDEKRNCLWVCTGDPNYSKFSDSSTYKKMIRFIGIDMSSGKKIEDINLSALFNGKHFANDFAMDSGGNMYITDSYSPVIYKVDVNGKASVFATSDMFKGENIGLNGIAYNPKGFLLVTNTSNGSLLKVDINNPHNVIKVKIKDILPGADGIFWDEQGKLILIQNAVNKAFQFQSIDNWQTAEVKASTAATDRFQYPSSGVIANEKIYLINSKINELNDPTQPPSKEFSLQLVQLKTM